MVTTFYPPYAFGGDANYVYQLSHALARRGHEVDVIHCVDSYRALAKGEPQGITQEEPGLRVHSITSGVGILSPLMTHLTGYPFFKSRQIRAILRAKPFDVIHFHNISLIGGPAILRYGTAIKLYTMHEHWLICPMHVLFKFNRVVCTQRACVRCQFSYRRPPQLWRATSLLTRSLRHVDAFISPSRFTIQRHLADGLRIPLVHLSPGLSMVSDSSPSHEDEGTVSVPPRPFFLFVGRLEKLKGVQTVIPLFHKTPMADLVIAGIGSYEGHLRELAAENPHVHFLGWCTASQLRQLYEKALAVIIPSLTLEVFPLVLLEAFAMGTPVIVRDLGPLPEVVSESGGGLIYRDVAELKHAMAQMRDDPVLRRRLGEAGQHAYQTRWTEDTHIEHYLQLIGEIRTHKAAALGGGQNVTPAYVRDNRVGGAW